MISKLPPDRSLQYFFSDLAGGLVFLIGWAEIFGHDLGEQRCQDSNLWNLQKGLMEVGQKLLDIRESTLEEEASFFESEEDVQHLKNELIVLANELMALVDKLELGKSEIANILPEGSEITEEITNAANRIWGMFDVLTNLDLE